jgi:hypothetical protein
MNTLFDDKIQDSPLYMAIRDNKSEIDIKNRLEEMWKVYQPYADPEFLKKFKGVEMESRFWEMSLGDFLIRNNFDFCEKKGGAGPDIKIQLNDSRICWIESVAPGNEVRKIILKQRKNKEPEPIPPEPIQTDIFTNDSHKEISAIIFSSVSLSTCVDPEQNDFHLFCNKYAQNPLPPHMIEKFREIMKVFELT